VDNVYDHFDVPNYPKTSATSVAHFVHFPSPLIQDGDSKVEVQKAINRQVSKVCAAYAGCMLNLTCYRFNFHSIVITLILRIYNSLAKTTRIRIIRHSIA
jgi:hypothetical protein